MDSSDRPESAAHHPIDVRKKIADGVRDADEGRLIPHEEVKKRLLGS